MSWLSRLFGSTRSESEATTAPTVSDSADLNTTSDENRRVKIPSDLAGALTASGLPLEEAVATALRQHLEVIGGKDQVPFWLSRDKAKVADLEDTLRDRIADRRTQEDES